MNDDDFRAVLSSLASTQPAIDPSVARAAVKTRARRYRHRRRAAVGILVAAVSVLVVAVVVDAGLHRTQSVTVTSPRSVGTAVGHIDACSGLPEPTRYVGGTVVALRGRIRYRRLTEGVSKEVLPTDVVARQIVPAGREYHFTLPPGSYIIDLRLYEHHRSNVDTHVSVLVRSQQTVHADLPNNCK
jgi:hypothetical protein